MVECNFCKCFVDTLREKYLEVHKAEQEEEESEEYRKSCTNSLENWEKWLKIRSTINQKLSERLSRRPGDLLMNIAEDYRNVREEKNLIEIMKTNVHFDKWRGNPAFWTLPPSLEEKCGRKCRTKCPCEDPIYFAVRLSEQKNEIPIIQYIGISNYILDEKMLLPKTRNIFTLWQRSSYRKLVLDKISPKLKTLSPHRPDNATLILIGTPKDISEQKNDKEPGVIIKENKELSGSEWLSKNDESISREIAADSLTQLTIEEESNTFKVHTIETVHFVINGTEISSSIQEQGTMKVRVLFEVGEIPEIPLTRYVKLENKGKLALRIRFFEYEKFKTFRSIIPSVIKQSPFYFDLRMLVLIPAQTIMLPIWFKPTTTGHFIETWKICVEPQYWSESFNLFIVLQGIVYKQDFHHEAKAIHKMLSARVRSTLIEDVIKDLVNFAQCQKTKITNYTYSERQFFEATNQDYWNTSKGPKYLFNKLVVEELKTFHRNVRESDDELEWNYSIQRLKELARKRDVLNYIDKLYQQCEKEKKRTSYLHALYCGSNTELVELPIEEEATNAENTLMSSNETQFEQLSKLLQKLERPVMIKNKHREKYAMAYYIMRYYILKASESLSGSYYPFMCLYNTMPFSTIGDVPDRLAFEKFNSIWIERHRRVPPVPDAVYPCKPKPIALEHIDSVATELIYNTYFKKKSNVKQEKKKGKKDKAKKPSKTKIKGKSTQANLNKLAPDSGVVEEFNPFKELLVKPPKVEDSMITTTKLASSSLLHERKSDVSLSYYEKYLIVYSHLSAGIDALVAGLETLKENEIPTGILSDLATCNVKSAGRYLRVPSVPSKETENQSHEIKYEDADYNLEKNEYYQSLINRHLKHNATTQEFFVKGEKQNIPQIPSIQEQKMSLKPKIESFTLFKLEDDESEESSEFKSGGMQTSRDEYQDYMRFSNVLLEQHLLVERFRQQEVTEEDECVLPVCQAREQSSEIFYFVADDL